jgi:hypothetical protein
MNPQVGEYIAKTELVVQGTTATPSQVAIRLFRQEIGGRTRLARGKNIRVQVANTGTVANSTNATIAATAGFGNATVGTAHTATKDITFSEAQGVAQVETATVVAASGATANGTLVVTVTSALFTAPVAVNVALTTAEDTAAKVATAMRSALTANATVGANFTVGGSSAAVALTAKVNAANDTTLNIAWPATIAGVAAVTASVNTTAGVALSKGLYRISVTDATAETVDLLITDNVVADGVPIAHLRVPITHAAP